MIQSSLFSKVCCGPNAGDTYWTENVLKTCFENAPEWMHGFMDGLSLHYYTLPEDDWSHKEVHWTSTMQHGIRRWQRLFKLDELIHKHSTIMDKYDPEKKIGLICDEWGTWYDVEPGTNPGFLYQQSTMRDALVAGLSLNIFNKHCDRVKMANIAQLINVLQAVILTEGPKMLRTPKLTMYSICTNTIRMRIWWKAISMVWNRSVKMKSSRFPIYRNPLPWIRTVW